MKKHILLACALFAHLAASAQLNGNGYYRIKNKVTGNYATLASDEMSYQKVVDGIGGSNLLGDTKVSWFGTSTPKNPSKNGAYPTVIAKMGCYLQNDIRQVKDGTLNTASVFYLEKNGNQYNLKAEGTDLKAITTGQYSASIKVDFPGFYTTVKSLGNNLYNVYIPVSAKALIANVNVGNFYFCDNAGTFGVEKDAGSKDEAQWYIEPATTFNVKPLDNVKDRSGHYYTTLCVDFPFSIPESGSTVLAAYTVTGQDANGKAVLNKLTGTIAGGTPVILECASDDEATNVLNIESTEPAGKACKNGQMVESDGNYLKGRYFTAPAETYQYKNYLNQVKNPTTENFTTDGNKLVNDKDNYRVLNCVNGNIGFYKLKDDKAIMAANKAFLYIKDLPTVTSSAKTLDIEEASEVTGVKNICAEKHSGAIYDLQGRLVEHPSKHGIYIVNGKKVIIK
ncbi:MAG: hypothetical protein PUG75_02310 [Prevotella sp.]|nr:hypothetical protein [Prevotella sp.]MDY5258382.1 hypothetical protein [Prevotella sp.]